VSDQKKGDVSLDELAGIRALPRRKTKGGKVDMLVSELIAKLERIRFYQEHSHRENTPLTNTEEETHCAWDALEDEIAGHCVALLRAMIRAGVFSVQVRSGDKCIGALPVVIDEDKAGYGLPVPIKCLSEDDPAH
jgi:hypothetical protein